MTLEVVDSQLVPNGMAINSHVAHRIREASRDQVPLDQLLLQLRQIVVGPSERVTEARIEELLDFLEEQKSSNDTRFDMVSARVEGVAGKTARLEGDLLNLDRILFSLSDRVGDVSRQLNESFDSALTQARAELDSRMQTIADMLRNSFRDLESRVTNGIRELSNSLQMHIAEGDVQRQRDHEHFMTQIEQRIAQWRAEIDAMRRGDMEEVASSMMDIGQRLMSLRKM